MKPSTTLTATLTALTLSIAGCDSNKAVPHDHDGDGKPDHANHDDHADHADHDDHADHADHADHDDHDDHDHPLKTAGPNGGRIITAVSPHAEFFVTPDNKVRITFLSDDNKAIPVADQSVEVIGGNRSNPTTLSFAREADGMSLLSTGTLPAGNKYPLIVSIKPDAEAALVRDKFTLDLSSCPTCEYKEYACTCDHDHGHSH